MKRALTLATTLGLGIVVVLPDSALAIGDPAAGKEKSTVCASCHGPDGNSTQPQNPILAGQYPTYIIHSLKAYKSGERENAVMKGFAANLSEQDMKDLAAYYGQQEGLVVAPRK